MVVSGPAPPSCPFPRCPYPPTPHAHAPPRPPPPTHKLDRSSSAEHIDAPSEIFLSFPEFLELLGLLSYALALSRGWEASGAGSVLGKIQALVRETAAQGAPWGKLAQGQKLLAACAPAPQL